LPVALAGYLLLVAGLGATAYKIDQNAETIERNAERRPSTSSQRFSRSVTVQH